MPAHAPAPVPCLPAPGLVLGLAIVAAVGMYVNLHKSIWLEVLGTWAFHQARVYHLWRMPGVNDGRDG